MTTNHQPTRTAITKTRLIPTCYATIWKTPPGPGLDPEHRGTITICRARATHRLTWSHNTHEGIAQYTTKICRAHIADEIDKAERDRDFAQYLHRVTVPELIITELEFTLDTRAAAHGNTRIWLTEHHHPNNQPIPLELFATNPLLALPRRTRRPEPAPRPDPPHQHALFDNPRTPARHFDSVY
ncbi:hypothetical protein ACFWPX_30165 [Nocardia sp. NPDC058518]|uniref:hypothetical protein n=1 Tax=Nocardia sp. NPDC058518 TaxID=3346534 RepID=UPI00364DB040